MAGMERYAEGPMTAEAGPALGEEALQAIVSALTRYAGGYGVMLSNAAIKDMASLSLAALAPHVVALVAQARAEGERAERERIADACEDEARDYEQTRQQTAPYVVRRLVSAAYEHAARIARGEP